MTIQGLQFHVSYPHWLRLFNFGETINVQLNCCKTRNVTMKKKSQEDIVRLMWLRLRNGGSGGKALQTFLGQWNQRTLSCKQPSTFDSMVCDLAVPRMATQYFFRSGLSPWDQG